VTGQARDDRYHVPVTVGRTGRCWQADLTAVLRIKDAWHRLPSYPDKVGAREIYTAVLDDGVRTPQQFAAWLARHDLPT
jgi:hypothetical protein